MARPRRTGGLTRRQVEELTKLRQSLRRVERKVAADAAPEAVRAAARVVRAAVVREAPKDTGFLASHVRVEPTRVGPDRVSLAVSVGERDFAGKTFYAAMVEYGTALQPANPFMRRAVDLDGPRALRAAKAIIAARLKAMS